MRLTRRHLAASLSVLAAFGAAPAMAQAPWPEKPITVVVPFAAGGPTDVMARLVGEHMSKTLGQQLVIENVAGAGGTTGMTRVATATPDGYTIGVGNMGTQSAAPALYPNLKYNPSTSFDQIGIVNFNPMAIIAKKNTPGATLADLVKHLKANEGKVSMGHAGVGSVSYTIGMIFNSQIGIKPSMVAYRGTGPALNDLVAGQIDVMIDQASNNIAQIQAGTVKGFAVTAPKRLDSIANVPTTTEAGMPEFKALAWNAMVGPKGMPKPIVDKLSAALSAALDDANIKKRYGELGSTAPEGAERGPAGLQKLVDSEVARITPILKAAGAVAQ
jgi:tripartite-type tricarboxylate transporter receptor subunit TctC